MSLHVISNMAAGQKLAAGLLNDYIYPRLNEWNKENPSLLEPQFHETNAACGAMEIGRSLTHDTLPIVAIVLGGDGTVHELLEGMVRENGFIPDEVQIVLVPTGTANALYHSVFGPGNAEDDHAWRFRSFDAFIKGDTTKCKPLTLIHVQPNNHVASVVSSHSLHAAILRDSEALRLSHPGIERFKMAAELNITSWCNACLTLIPPKDGKVLSYNAKEGKFLPTSNLDEDYVSLTNGQFQVFGSFAYMNAMVVDRLEPTFVPAPFAGFFCDESLRRPRNTIDIVVVRPPRSPKVFTEIQNGNEETNMRKEYAQDVLSTLIFEGMYSHGAHLNYTYKPDGHVELHGDGRYVVEYFRVGAYEWIAASDDAQARTLCVDGTIEDVDKVSAHAKEKENICIWS
ncbi:D-erythro-sphingosine kinase [Malassezia pachydermatis]